MSYSKIQSNICSSRLSLESQIILGTLLAKFLPWEHGSIWFIGFLSEDEPEISIYLKLWIVLLTQGSYVNEVKLP